MWFWLMKQINPFLCEILWRRTLQIWQRCCKQIITHSDSQLPLPPSPPSLSPGLLYLISLTFQSVCRAPPDTAPSSEIYSEASQVLALLWKLAEADLSCRRGWFVKQECRAIILQNRIAGDEDEPRPERCGPGQWEEGLQVPPGGQQRHSCPGTEGQQERHGETSSVVSSNSVYLN